MRVSLATHIIIIIIILYYLYLVLLKLYTHYIVFTDIYDCIALLCIVSNNCVVQIKYLSIYLSI